MLHRSPQRRMQMIERRVEARKRNFLDPCPVLVHVETPTAGLQLAAFHQLIHDVVRMVERTIAVGKPEGGLVFNGPFAVFEREGIERHWRSLTSGYSSVIHRRSPAIADTIVFACAGFSTTA